MRNGFALLFALVAMVLLGALVIALPWRFGAEWRSAAEHLAMVRAEQAARGAVVSARGYLESLPAESLGAGFTGAPLPVVLPAGARGIVEISVLDTSLVEVVAEGMAGGPSHELARMRLCGLLAITRVSDSSGTRIIVAPLGRAAVVGCP